MGEEGEGVRLGERQEQESESWHLNFWGRLCDIIEWVSEGKDDL